MKALIIAANSAIAQAVARKLAEQQWTLFLVGRDADKLEILRNDLLTRGAVAVETYQYDFTDHQQHSLMLEKAKNRLMTVDLVLIAQGQLPDQTACQQDYHLALDSVSINTSSVIAQSILLSNWLEYQGSGVLAVISSVAGDRGRKTNYVYGSTKAAVNIFYEGLRHRLSSKGVTVLTIKPGLVDSPMTAGISKGMLWAQPEKVASDIVKAVIKKRNHIYTPWFWRWIMLVVRTIPDRLFAKMEM